MVSKGDISKAAALTRQDLMDTNELNGVLSELREGGESARTKYGNQLMSAICDEVSDEVHCMAPVDLELRLRIVGNCVADHEGNRDTLSNKHVDFLRNICLIDTAKEPKVSTVALSVLFNYANDNPSGLNLLSQDPHFFWLVQAKVEAGDAIGLNLVDLCLESKHDGFSNTLGRDIVCGFDFEPDDDEVAKTLLSAFESKPEREGVIAGDKPVLEKFIKATIALAGTNSALAIALLGGVSFADEFLTSVEQSLTDPVYLLLNEGIKQDNVSTTALCGLALGNLTPSESKIHTLVQLNGNVIPRLCAAVLQSQLAAELQCTFLLKNIATASIDYARQILDHGGLDIVAKLAAFTVVPQIRAIGVSLARALVRATTDTQKRELFQILTRHIDDDGFPLDDAYHALADLALTDLASEVLVKHLGQLSPNTLLKVTRSIGTLLPNIDCAVIEQIVSHPVFDTLDRKDPLFTGIASNVAYIAANSSHVSSTSKTRAFARVEEATI